MSLGKTPWIFTASVGLFYMERSLKFQLTALEGPFQVKHPISSFEIDFVLRILLCLRCKQSHSLRPESSENIPVLLQASDLCF